MSSLTGCVLHGVPLQEEYWGLFPTWEMAAEAANAAWLAHNLGLDDGEALSGVVMVRDVV